MEKIATRVSYGQALKALGATHPEVMVLDADLSGVTMSNQFAAAYPERFFNMGIAEADMFGVAGGMASCGKTVFANTFAMFSAGRCWEQIRNGIAYPDLNVKVIGGHGGISIGQDGATHQCIEDFGLMRTIPGMTVVCPCDDHEMKCAVAALAEYPHTAYMRLGRMPVETVTDAVPGYRFELGKGAVLRGGSDVTVIACGIMVQMALEAAEALQAEGLSVRVIDMHTIKPLDEELVLQAARETGAIVTAEEHNVKGGLGAAVCEAVMQKEPVPVVLHGVRDCFGRSGLPEELLEEYGLTAQARAASVRKAAARKKYAPARTEKKQPGRRSARRPGDFQQYDVRKSRAFRDGDGRLPQRKRSVFCQRVSSFSDSFSYPP